MWVNSVEDREQLKKEKPMETKYLRINGIDIAYIEKGEGSPLLFIHGNGESKRIFLPYFEAFQDIHCIAADSRGHGQSFFNERYTVSDMADDMNALLEKLDLKNVTVVGYSDGANVAVSMAKKSQDRLGKLVLVSGNLYASAQTLGFRLSCAIYTALLFPLSLFSARKKRRIAKNMLMLRDIGVSLADLEKISLPSWVVDAEKDMIKRAHTDAMAEALPLSRRITINGATHFDILKSKDFVELLHSITAE